MRRASVVVLVLGIALGQGTAIGAASVTAVGTHELAAAFGAPAPDSIVDVVENRFELTFDPRGGFFTGTGHIRYRHTITNEFCSVGVFETPIDITYRGTFTPAMDNLFVGRVEIFTAPTTQSANCPDFGYTYNGPTQTVWPFIGQLDPRSGHFTEITGFFGAVADSDPSTLEQTPSPTRWAVGTLTGFAVGDVLAEGDTESTVVENGLTFQLPTDDYGLMTGRGIAAVHHVVSEDGTVVCQWTAIDEIIFHGFIDGLGPGTGTAAVTTTHDTMPGCVVAVPEADPRQIVEFDWNLEATSPEQLDFTIEMVPTSSFGGVDGPDRTGLSVDILNATRPASDGTVMWEFGFDPTAALDAFGSSGLDATVVFNMGTFYVDAAGEARGGFASLGLEATDGNRDISSWSDFLFQDGMVFHVGRSTTFEDGKVVDTEITEHAPQAFNVDLTTGEGSLIVNEGGLQFPISFEPLTGKDLPDGGSSGSPTTLPGSSAGDPFASSNEGRSEERDARSMFLIISVIIAILGAGAIWLRRRNAAAPASDAGRTEMEPSESDGPPLHRPTPLENKPVTLTAERRPNVCGPDVTIAYTKAIVRLAERMMVGRTESWLLLAPGTGVEFLRENGPAMDFYVKALEGDPCGTCPGCGPTGGRYLCYTFDGMCYPAHYFGDTIFGMSAGLLGVWDSVASAGAYTAEWMEYGTAFSQGEAVSQQIYPVAAALGRKYIDRPFPIGTDDIREILAAPGVSSDCEPCPIVAGDDRIYKDFTSMDWTLAGTTFEKPRRRRRVPPS